MARWLFTAFLLFQIQAHAQSPSCFDQLQENLKLQLSEKQKTCVQNDPQAQMAFADLCSPDGKTVSNAYGGYRKFEMDYRDVMSELQSDNNRRSFEEVAQELAQIEKNWEHLGSKTLVSEAIVVLDFAAVRCRNTMTP